VWAAAVVARGERVTAEHLSLFYRQFLEANDARHRAFHRSWWAESVRMLAPALRAQWQRWRRPDLP
jgi:hypothetical protein